MCVGAGVRVCGVGGCACTCVCAHLAAVELAALPGLVADDAAQATVVVDAHGVEGSLLAGHGHLIGGTQLAGDGAGLGVCVCVLYVCVCVCARGRTLEAS